MADGVDSPGPWPAVVQLLRVSPVVTWDPIEVEEMHQLVQCLQYLRGFGENVNCQDCGRLLLSTAH